MEYLIGDFSTISRLGIKTLRYYHEIGLLHPSRVDAFSGYRYYDEHCLARVRTIHRLKELGFSLAEIREILTTPVVDETLLQTMQSKLDELDQKLAAFQQTRARLASLVQSESVPLIFPSEVTEKDIPDLLIASIRFNGRYSDLSTLISRLLGVCAPLATSSPFSLYHDDHPMEDDADIEICVAVSQSVDQESIRTRRLPGGHVVSILHHGNYDQIWVSYQAIVDYLNHRHLEPLLPSREIYLQGGEPASHPAAQNLLTEIQFQTRIS